MFFLNSQMLLNIKMPAMYIRKHNMLMLSEDLKLLDKNTKEEK